MSSNTAGHETQSWQNGCSDMDDEDIAYQALDKLTELAIIATGPQSPLLQLSHQESTTNGFEDVRAFNSSIHSYAKPSPMTLESSPKLLKSKCSFISDENNNLSDTPYTSMENSEPSDKIDPTSSWDSRAAALALSHMASNHTLLCNGSKQGSSSAPTTPVKKRHKSTSSKMTAGVCKRPMNAFMLFAKRFRVEYTQLHPGKDNRAISIVLGDKWRQLCKGERAAYAQEAKQMADEYKKTNPDCWKRKRSNSTST